MNNEIFCRLPRIPNVLAEGTILLRTGMNARMLGITCALLAAMANLVGCESSQGQDYQFEKQVKRAQECRQLQDKLIGDSPSRLSALTR
jgi:hypothetical protein